MVKGISTRNLEREKYLMTCSNNARAPMKAVKVVFLSNACSGQGFDLKLNWKWSLRDVVKSCLFNFGKINKKLIPVCSILLVKRQFILLETWKSWSNHVKRNSMVQEDFPLKFGSRLKRCYVMCVKNARALLMVSWVTHAALGDSISKRICEVWHLLSFFP